VLGLLATMLVTGKGWKRIFAWWWNAIRHPVEFRRAGCRSFARQTLILPRDADIDATLRFQLRRRCSGRSRACCALRVNAFPTNHPAGNAFARGRRRSSAASRSRRTRRSCFDLPMTAHCIGGCVMGADAAHGVIDSRPPRVRLPGLYVVDGAAVGANLGVIRR